MEPTPVERCSDAQHITLGACQGCATIHHLCATHVADGPAFTLGARLNVPAPNDENPAPGDVLVGREYPFLSNQSGVGLGTVHSKHVLLSSEWESAVNACIQMTSFKGSQPLQSEGCEGAVYLEILSATQVMDC